MTSHYSSRNHGGYVDRDRSGSQDTNHSYSINRGTQVEFEGRGGYRSPKIHYSSHNQVECGILLNFSGDTVDSDWRVGYMSHTRHCYS